MSSELQAPTMATTRLGSWMCRSTVSSGPISAYLCSSTVAHSVSSCWVVSGWWTAVELRWLIADSVVGPPSRVVT